MTGSKTSGWLPDVVYRDGDFVRGQAIRGDDDGKVIGVAPTGGAENFTRLSGRALLPGLVNAHSHAFQRVIRGRTEYRTGNSDSFWTWREMMYSAAARLTPEDIYDASRMAFMEMALSGITAVGEFHYLHHAPDGALYEDPNLLSKQVVRAARDVGLRIALLRVAYFRSGFETETNPQQLRFIERDADFFIANVERLQKDLADAKGDAWAGVAPHSVRAVPLDQLRRIVQFANAEQLPVHMHVAEQPAEVSACIAEYGRSPVALLSTEGLLSERFTGVHVIHVTPKAVSMLASTGATVCACPTTERNLGDGVVPVDQYFQQGVPVALGSDSHVEINLLEDARELEYHLRLQKQQRVVLGEPADEGINALAARLFQCATANGARSIGAAGGGALADGDPADFFTVDLDHPSIAGATEDSLLSTILFSLSRSAVKDVVVDGKQIVEDGRHSQQEEIVERFKALQKKLWS